MTEPTVSIPAFLPFYLHLMPRDRVADRLRAPVAAVSSPAHLDTLIDEVWRALLLTVEGHSFRALIGEFHDFREGLGLPMTDDGDLALQQFRRSLEQADRCDDLLERYVVLRRRLVRVLANSLDAYADLFEAYADDRPALVTSGLLSTEDTLITGLFGTGGDLHNDNRQVVGVQLADGTRLLFKPRPLTSDQLLRRLCAVAEPHLAFSLRACVPRSTTIGSRGWQEFVTAHPMTDAEQPARYFYRFGALCAITGAVGASDLHDENLLASGEYPCIIDTETMIRANTGVDSDSLPHLLINQLKLSAATTMLLPMTNPNSPIDLIMAGVGVDGVQTSGLRRPTVRACGTDGIRVEWENVTHRHGDNVPRLGDAAVSSLDHFASIRAGYTDALAAVRDETLAEALDDYPDMPVRCLIRSTMVYTRFLDAATHPDYLGTTESAQRLLGLLGRYPDYLTSEGASYVGAVERGSLDSGNVPYFVTRAGSTELATPTSRCPGVHRSSPLDFARAGIALNAAQSDQYHHFVLEECLSELAGETSDGLHAQSVFAPTVEQARPGGWWPRIARTLAEVGVRFDAGPDGLQLGWVCGIGPDRHAPTMTPGNFISFHDNGGIVTFLRNAARDEPAVRDASLAADRGLDSLLGEYREIFLEVPEGIFTGAASMLLARPATATSGWLEQVLDAVDTRAEAGTLDTDLANGPAGLLMLLLARIEAGDELDIASERLTALRAMVLSTMAAGPATPWFDVAHGELGLWWAKARIGRVLGDSGLTTASEQWLTARLAADDQPTVTGWCTGAAGLLLSAAEIFTSAGHRDALSGDRLDGLVAAASRLPTDRPVDLSVCHGSSGVVQSLLAAAYVLDDPSLIDRAREYQNSVLATIRAHGFHTGATGRTSLLGYMFGWSGIGDTDLLLRQALTGTVPAVPIALAASVPGTQRLATI